MTRSVGVPVNGLHNSPGEYKYRENHNHRENQRSLGAQQSPPWIAQSDVADSPFQVPLEEARSMDILAVLAESTSLGCSLKLCKGQREGRPAYIRLYERVHTPSRGLAISLHRY